MLATFSRDTVPSDSGPASCYQPPDDRERLAGVTTELHGPRRVFRMPRVAFSPYTNARGNQSLLLSFVAADTIAPLILPLIVAAFGRVTLD